ncbi:MAG: NADPH-dependent F420 reductase [Proteobacteria bacterium]|nr:NADPH-dependent F420 reductase [Pseudomonadota bacterium]HQR03571.1 NADPH-dependent F420 reductase [Rhodocyclaceae bacterium]
MTQTSLPQIAVLGGTGNLGYALARRWVKAGYTVHIGSRGADKAQEAATKLSADVGKPVRSGTNRDVAAAADIVVITVPFASQAAILEDIKPVVGGKLVVDTTVPLVPPKVMRVQLPAEGAAALIAQKMLGAGVTLVSAFHSVAAHKLVTDVDVECDVLVFGDDKAARKRVIALAEAAGLRGLHGGSLANSAAAEALTSILIFLNKTYAVDGAGIRITGQLVPPADE